MNIIMKKITALITVIVIAISLCAFFSSDEEVKAYSIEYGIDVSYHNGFINWDEVRKTNISFSIIRAGFGKFAYQKDKQFDNNYTGAKRVGINTGCYWYSYALNKADAVQEADICYSVIKECEFELPVFYDLEDASLLHAGLTRNQITDIGISFCERLRSYGINNVGIYANRNWYENYLNKSAFLERKYEIWYAAYPSGTYAVNPLDYDNSSKCNIWQYSSKGTSPGISGSVDVNVLYSNEDIPKCICSEEYAGTYTTNSKVTTNLNIRSDHSVESEILGKIPVNSCFDVVKANGVWAHIIFDQISGFVDMSYIERKTISTEPVDYGYISGDISGNQTVDSIDALMLLKFMNNSLQLNDAQYKSADINDDGIINVVDLILIKNIISK